MSASIDNGISESDKDANSALLELDKGLRSSKLGDQCEAIVRFPRLFEKYPFPILINSAFLKLGDVFRNGINFLRLWVLKVAQQSEKHLDKILNVDEFVRRVFSVIHSNDPVARALTLRTLGSIAPIIAERKNAHHSIRHSLDSHDAVELEAAIYAADRFSTFSKTFANGICWKIEEMIHGLATPIEMKLKLIPIFRHMHYDSHAAARVRQLCTNMLPNYASQEFVEVSLITLSELASKTIVHIPEQIKLLLTYLTNDPRQAIKIAVLKNCLLLAKTGPHMWGSDDIEVLCKLILDSQNEKLQLSVFTILTTLAKSPAADKFNANSDSLLLEVYNECCYHRNVAISAEAVDLYTQLTIQKKKVGAAIAESELYEGAAAATESLLVLSSMSAATSDIYFGALKVCLRSTVLLCENFPSLSSGFVDIIGSLMITGSDRVVGLLCEVLSAIASQRPEVLESLQGHIIELLKQLIDRKESDNKIIVSLSTLIFQVSNKDIDEEITNILKDGVKVTNGWLCYKIARQAARYGHHSIASYIFNQLTSVMSSEHFYFWLQGLREITLGESFLKQSSADSNEQLNLITKSAVHYHTGISALKAATMPAFPLHFQCDFARLRVEMLQAHAQLIRACGCLKTSPPPAIAVSLALNTGDELQKCGRTVSRLLQCMKEFRFLGDRFTNLHQTSFDADPATLTNIQSLQESCFLIAFTLESLIFPNKVTHNLGDETPDIFQSGSNSESMKVKQACHKVMPLIQSVLNQEQEQNMPLTHKHIQCIIEVSNILTKIPLYFPRFFFQILQSTSIKLAISPQPRIAGEPVSIQSEAHLALKVEGVIQHNRKPGLFRKIHKVKLSVVSVLQSRSHPNVDIKGQDNVNRMHQIVEPHNDYFNAQFLLAFPIPGFHIINIEASIIDQNGDTWKTGPHASLTVRSLDDTSQQKRLISKPSFSSNQIN